MVSGRAEPWPFKRGAERGRWLRSRCDLARTPAEIGAGMVRGRWCDVVRRGVVRRDEACDVDEMWHVM